MFTNLFSCIFLKEPCGVFEICNIFLVRVNLYLKQLYRKYKILYFVSKGKNCHMFQVLGGIVCVVQPPIIFGGNSEYTDKVRGVDDEALRRRKATSIEMRIQILMVTRLVEDFCDCIQ